MKVQSEAESVLCAEWGCDFLSCTRGEKKESGNQEGGSYVRKSGEGGKGVAC